ncbi:MAG: hypothetical protein N3A38_07630 [Planctomycetota bacterium]|nr:hypothetical protein [Planctomycetota bacterium]
MPEGDVRAGGAYIEIGARDEKLRTDLARAGGHIASWGREIGARLQTIGAAMAGLGGGIAAGLAGALRSFADYGEQMDRMEAQTGMGQAALAGLRTLAEDLGVSFEAVPAGIRAMQVAIADGTKESAEAFARLGVSVSDLAGLTPEDQFAHLADAIARMADPAARTAAAVDIFGRSGAALIPVLQGGAAAMAAAEERARRFGLVLDSEARENARRADEAFDGLRMALGGLKLALGEASAAFAPYIARLADVIARAGEWIRRNPQWIEAIGKAAIAVGAAGAAFLALGTAIAAAMSPALLAAGAILGIAAACLAAMDATGAMGTGFGEAFNAIRIAGTGLGTWLGGLWLQIEKGATHAAYWLSEALLWPIQKILDGFVWLQRQVLGAIEAIVAGANAVLSLAGMEIEMPRVAALGEETAAGIASARARMRRNYEENIREMTARERALFAADQQTAGGGIAFDAGRLREGLARIGDTVLAGAEGAFERLFGALPGAVAAAGGVPGGAAPAVARGAMPVGMLAGPPEFATTGTFVGGIAGMMAATQGNTVSLLQAIRDNTARIARNSEPDYTEALQ